MVIMTRCCEVSRISIGLHSILGVHFHSLLPCRQKDVEWAMALLFFGRVETIDRTNDESIYCAVHLRLIYSP